MAITDFMIINQFIENNYYQFIFRSLKTPTSQVKLLFTIKRN